MEISGFPRGGVHVSKGGCTCKQKGCTGRCSLKKTSNLKNTKKNPFELRELLIFYLISLPFHM